MTRTKIIFSIVLATIFLAAQVGSVGAAPATQDTDITGKVVDISLDTDSGVTTVLVTLDDGTGETQTYRLSLDDAADLGLLVDDQPVNPEDIDEQIVIKPDMVIPDEATEEEEHPVGSALSDFFTDLLGVDYDLIMEYHDDGMGFGVIAQALWMTNALNEEGETEIPPDELFKLILDAKQNKDFDIGIKLQDGTTPTNWGQFRKAIMSDREKAKENLGAVMSGKNEEGQEEEVDELAAPKNNGQGQDKDKNKENNSNNSNSSNSNSNNNSSNNSNNNNNSNNGQGQDKDKGKDKNNDKGNSNKNK